MTSGVYIFVKNPLILSSHIFSLSIFLSLLYLTICNCYLIFCCNPTIYFNILFSCTALVFSFFLTWKVDLLMLWLKKVVDWLCKFSFYLLILLGFNSIWDCLWHNLFDELDLFLCLNSLVVLNFRSIQILSEIKKLLELS